MFYEKIYKDKIVQNYGNVLRQYVSGRYHNFQYHDICDVLKKAKLGVPKIVVNV